MPVATSVSTGASDTTQIQRRRVGWSAFLGTTIEYYDFTLYGLMGPIVFGKLFFPQSDPTTAQIAVLAIYAVGFFGRPLGGLVFSHYGDRLGRKPMIISMSVMGLASTLMGLLPSYASIGIWAPIILGLARVIQGFSLGGEYGTSATYLTEVADQRHRGFYSSFQYVTLIGGQLCALVVLLVLQNVFLTNDEIRQWGWRIPFFIGAGLAVVAGVMRRNLQETEAFEAAKKVAKRTSSLRALMKYPREVLLVVGLTAGGTAAFYTYTTYMQKFLKLSVGLTDHQTTMVTAGTLIFAMFLQPIYGAISDHIGRKWLLIGFGVCGVLFTVPLLTGLQAANGPLQAFLLIAAAWMIVSGYTSINAVVKAELFPTSVRATGVGLPYALTVSIFGGSVEKVVRKPEASVIVCSAVVTV